MLRRAQGALEYVYLIGIVAAAIIATSIYMKRGFQGNLRSLSEQTGAGYYAPGNTTVNNTETKTSRATVVSSSTTTTNYGNTQSQTPEIAQKRADIQSLNAQLAALYTQRGQAISNGDWPAVTALDTQISTLQSDLSTAQTELRALIAAYKARGISPDQTTTASSDTGSGTETITKNTSESLGVLSGDR